jgi:hypothetical protein
MTPKPDFRDGHPTSTKLTLRRVMACLLGIAALAHVPVTSSAAAVSPNECVRTKNTCAGKGFRCLAREQNKAILGGTPDLEKCRTAWLKLEESTSCLAEAAAKPGCPVTAGCTPITPIPQRVEDAVNNVLAALQPNPPTTDAAKKCVVAKIKATAKYVSCMAKSVARGFEHTYFVSPYSPKCVSKLGLFFMKAEAKGGCLTTGDANTIIGLANPASTNLAGADLNRHRTFMVAVVDLRGADLADANLSDAGLFGEVDLGDACLKGAHVMGASFNAVIWSRTTCPDGSRSDSNGSIPESCCEHMVEPPFDCQS